MITTIISTHTQACAHWVSGVRATMDDVSGTCTITKPDAARDHFRSLQLAAFSPHLQQKLTRRPCTGASSQQQQQDEKSSTANKGDKCR
jgi:predicted alpha/beta hydrolase family esterase